MDEPRYGVRLAGQGITLVDNHNKVERGYSDWTYRGRKQDELVGRNVMGANLSHLIYCCGITEVGGYWIDGVPEADAYKAFTDAVMKDLKRNHASLVLTTFVEVEGAMSHSGIYRSFIDDQGWTPLLEPYINNRYRYGSTHTLHTIHYVFPKATKKRRITRG